MNVAQIAKRVLSGCILVAFLVVLPAGAALQPDATAVTQQNVYFPLIAKDAGLPGIALVDRIDGFDRPTHVTHAGDGSNRLFVVEQKGRIRIVQNGVLLPTPFLDIRDRVSCCAELGLFSVAFPPNYATKHHFYVMYTNKPGNTVVSRFSDGTDPNVADKSSEEYVFTVDQPTASHNGGQLAFSPQDGYLYIGMGDGGPGGDPNNRAQNPLEPFGKILRIDVESGVTPYAVPASNPFVGNPAYLPEIWAMGLRNPWRFSFDRLNADLYIGDVGQELYEEVNYQPAVSTGGQNYGWRIMEGEHCYGAATCDMTGLTLPIHTYDHSEGCSVTGGVVYRGALEPRLQGVYIYGDFCSGRIWGLQRAGAGWTNQLLHQQGVWLTSFGEDEQGEVYLTDVDAGRIYRIAVAP